MILGLAWAFETSKLATSDTFPLTNATPYELIGAIFIQTTVPLEFMSLPKFLMDASEDSMDKTRL